MPQDVETSRIANAAIAPEEHEEIEVTPEMIEAGASALLDDCNIENLRDGFVTAQKVAEEVFLAMCSARQPNPSIRSSRHR
jgi:hypothetical protein